MIICDSPSQTKGFVRTKARESENQRTIGHDLNKRLTAMIHLNTGEISFRSNINKH